jgi:hypothetical protein
LAGLKDHSSTVNRLTTYESILCLIHTEHHKDIVSPWSGSSNNYTKIFTSIPDQHLEHTKDHLNQSSFPSSQKTPPTTSSTILLRSVQLQVPTQSLYQPHRKENKWIPSPSSTRLSPSQTEPHTSVSNPSRISDNATA